MKHNKYLVSLLITPLLLTGCTTNEYKGEMEIKTINFSELSGDMMSLLTILKPISQMAKIFHISI